MLQRSVVGYGEAVILQLVEIFLDERGMTLPIAGPIEGSR